MKGTYDENPAPSLESAKSVHLHETIRENTSKSRRHAADEVEHSIALLELVPGVPARKKISATREETGLEDTENDTKSNKFFPSLDETKALGGISAYLADLCGNILQS